MATHNGMNWLDKQIESILNQIKVEVTIFISDDNSDDGTSDYLSELEKNNRQIVLLPKKKSFGSAAKNFYYLLSEVNFKGFSYISLSDQDDIWNKDKLSTHIDLLEKNNAVAVSSNVTAFWPNGRKILIEKSQPQRKYDFLFEGPGPGCSFLISPWLANKVKYHLKKNTAASQVTLHDWLIYAICRAYKKKWIISPCSSLRYRQHLSNVLGANVGLKAAINRLKNVTNGWYRNQVCYVSEVVNEINNSPRLHRFNNIIHQKLYFNQLYLIPFALEGRRKIRERFFLILCILVYLF